MKRTIVMTLCMALLSGCGLGDPLRRTYEWVRNPAIGQSSSDVDRQSREAVTTLTEAGAFDLADPDRRREAIAKASDGRGGLKEPYLKAYATMTEDVDPLVRCAAVCALGRAGDPAYLAVILDALDDVDLRVRLDAAEALANVHGDAAIEPLRTRAASNPEQDLRVRCLRALRNYKSEPVLDTLVAALNDEAYGVRYAARESLAAMTGEDLAYDARQWRRALTAKDDPFARAPEPQRQWWKRW